MSTVKWDSQSRGGWGWEQQGPSGDAMQTESKAVKVQAAPDLNRAGEGGSMAGSQPWHLSYPLCCFMLLWPKYSHSLRTFWFIIVGEHGRVTPSEERIRGARTRDSFLISWQPRKQKGLRNQELSGHLQRSIPIGLFLPSRPFPLRVHSLPKQWHSKNNGKNTSQTRASGDISDSNYRFPLGHPETHGHDITQNAFGSTLSTPNLNIVQRLKIQEPGEVARWCP